MKLSNFAALMTLALTCSAAAPAPSRPVPAVESRPAWTVGLGMRDLEEDIRDRAGAATRLKLMEPGRSAALLEQLERLEREERGYRESRTFTEALFKRTEEQLIDLARALPFIPPGHPPMAAPTLDWSAAAGEPALDLTGMAVAFSDEFDRPTVTPDGGKGPWFAPIHSSFGAATFDPPSPSGPFFLRRSGGWTARTSALVIRARMIDGAWRSGLMQTVDSRGRGFAQRYGYFEMRAKLPKGFATWPAFWLLTQNGYSDQTQTRGELDVMEQYGSEPDRLHSAVHLWPAAARNAGGLAKHWYRSRKVNLSGLSEGFHRFGVMVNPTSMTIYYDGRPLHKVATLPPFDGPLYVVVDLAMHEKNLSRATDPSEFVIDYVRVYAPPKAWAREG